MSSLANSRAVSKRAVSEVLAAMLIASLLVFAGPARATANGPESSGIPRSCPPAALVRSTLKLKVSKVMSSTSVPELPYGSEALPKKEKPLLEKTCVYAADGKYSGTIVPTTISFSELHSTKEFTSARSAASQSVHPITVRGLGDAAWLVNPPKGDPRAGASLFVLRGTTDIVISAPPQASNADLETLARKLMTIPLKLA